MKVVFYVLGGLACLMGAMYLYDAVRLEGTVMMPSGEPYDTSFHTKGAERWFALGLPLLAAGAVLQRLDRIVHYSRMTALASKEAAGK